ncbi:signal peptide peptidase SppA [Desulfovibrio psychrotolerans]|uniref:Signal peptide peptidase SppA n=1 Tax=Desulfovibrio psychrotolerans TaxID=415242 RepID=A0A7J0BU66_9BACT|nr:signal peptide peptidase SppA [Desulfovibrio psychrotolerans]GFM36722.1 signal peptide peptidase SppA [Desulfovibrio psychrotolerans]
MQPNKLSFQQKHPLLFALMLILAAVALFSGVMAALRHSGTSARGGLFREDRLGLCRIEGFIADSAKVNDWLRELREDPAIIGVMLRIDSPGGAVAPSQEIYNAVRRLAQIKPVVVSMGTVAASGGYYIAAAADHIVANPSTLTGSIGVKMELANMEGLMDKLGIAHDALTSGDLKNAGSPFKPMTDKERAYLQGLVSDMHEQFLEAIAAGRNMDLEEVRKSADGRALTGRQAMQLGLVDSLGDLETAFERLAELCNATQSAPLPYVEGPPKEKSFLRDLLSSYLGIELDSSLRRRSEIRFLYL